MTIGYDKPLYVLPFDHRATFSKTMFGWEGPLSAGTDGANRRHQGGDLRRLQGGRRRRGPQGACRDPRGRAVRRATSCATPQDERVHHLLPRGEEWPGRVRLRVRPGLRPSHRGIRPDVLQGAGALQPGGGPGDESAPGRPAEAVVGLPAHERPVVHVRAARAPRAGPAASGSATTRRPTTSSCAPP